MYLTYRYLLTPTHSITLLSDGKVRLVTTLITASGEVKIPPLWTWLDLEICWGLGNGDLTIILLN